jgi:hypothetical protein
VDTVYHVESVRELIENVRRDQVSPSDLSWLRWNPEAICREALALSNGQWSSYEPSLQ